MSNDGEHDSVHATWVFVMDRFVDVFIISVSHIEVPARTCADTNMSARERGKEDLGLLLRPYRRTDRYFYLIQNFINILETRLDRDFSIRFRNMIFIIMGV